MHFKSELLLKNPSIPLTIDKDIQGERDAADGV